MASSVPSPRRGTGSAGYCRRGVIREDLTYCVGASTRPRTSTCTNGPDVAFARLQRGTLDNSKSENSNPPAISFLVRWGLSVLLSQHRAAGTPRRAGLLPFACSLSAARSGPWGCCRAVRHTATEGTTSEEPARSTRASTAGRSSSGKGGTEEGTGAGQRAGCKERQQPYDFTASEEKTLPRNPGGTG